MEDYQMKYIAMLLILFATSTISVYGAECEKEKTDTLTMGTGSRATIRDVFIQFTFELEENECRVYYTHKRLDTDYITGNLKVVTDKAIIRPEKSIRITNSELKCACSEGVPRECYLEVSP